MLVYDGLFRHFQIDKDLDYGRTEHCDTFENEPLCESVEFRIQMLEAYVFT